MDITLSGLSSSRILVYMDDIVIFSRSFPEHLSDFTEIFQRLHASKISLKLSKCLFACSKVGFPGYELSRTGIQPQARLTDAIRSYQRPLSKKELKGFLGLTRFYRAFVPNFSMISRPLSKLTSDYSQYVWTEDCEKVFCHLKGLLTAKPILQFLDLNKPFTLEVNASHFAVGEIFSQLGSDQSLHPVAYFSTTLRGSQLNWSATEKEAYALVMAVWLWHVYLAVSHFTLHSDHNPLTHLHESKNPQRKIGRWLSELEEYDYTIK